MIRTETRVVTPEMAARWLAGHSNYRNLRDRYVDRLARDMTSGRWALNGEAIKLDANGDLVDGQHRLAACVRSGMPFETLIVSGVKDDLNLDAGIKRTLADHLRHRGEANSNQLGAAITLSIRWEAGAMRSANMTPTHEEALAWLAHNPEIRDSVRIMSPLASRPLYLRASVGAAFHYAAATFAPEDAEVFVERLKTGADLGQDDPIRRFREWLMKQGEERGKTVDTALLLAFMIKAWNAYERGEPMRAISWRRGGASPEAFPEMIIG